MENSHFCRKRGPILVPQAPQHAFGEPLHHGLRFRTACGRVLYPPQRDEVLLLRGDQLRAVHVHQRLAARDRLSRGVHVQLLDPALEARRDFVQQPFVRLNGSHRKQGAAQFAKRKMEKGIRVPGKDGTA